MTPGTKVVWTKEEYRIHPSLEKDSNPNPSRFVSKPVILKGDIREFAGGRFGDHITVKDRSGSLWLLPASGFKPLSSLTSKQAEEISQSVFEAWLDERDERVKQKLVQALEKANQEIEEAERVIQDRKNELRLIKQAVYNQEWWKLGFYLHEQDINSLCETSPLDLLDD